MKYKMTIGCSKINLAQVRSFVADILKGNAFKEVEAHKLVLAVDEVCANLIIHSNHCNPNHSIEIAVDLTPHEKVIFIIKDKGDLFDFRHYQEPSLEDIVSAKKKGGVGLMLVKRIMDEIEFTTDKNYNICRLTKKLDQ